jgi:hypothetical protein
MSAMCVHLWSFRRGVLKKNRGNELLKGKGKGKGKQKGNSLNIGTTASWLLRN